MKLNAGIQEALLAILCFDDTPGGAKVALAMVPPRSYDTYFRDVAEKAQEFIEKYKAAPGEHTLDIIDQLKSQKEESAAIFDRIYRSLLVTKEGLNRDYVLGQANLFYRQQKLKALFTQGIGLLQQGKDSSVDEAEALLFNTTKNTAEAFDPGLLLNDPRQAMAYMSLEDEYFETGIDVLDRYNLGPVRKGMHLLVAGPNKGKSWWLNHLGRASMVFGRRRVLHITCEMKKEQVAMRYLQMLFSLTKKKAKVVYQRLLKEKGSFVGVEQREIDNRPSMDLDDITHLLLKKCKRLENRPPFWIKEFPTGVLTIPMLRGYLDSMEGRHAFMPDLLLIDYPDIMHINPANKRAETGTLYVNLRGIAGERNLALACVTQANREAEHARKAIIQGKNLSEDYSKFATADTILTYNQTDEEYQLGMARLFNLKSRSDKKNTTLLISQAYDMGQFCLDSAKMKNTDSRYWQLVGDGEDGTDGEESSDDDD